RTDFQSDRTILLLEDETKCQVEFHDLCVHRSLSPEGGMQQLWREVALDKISIRSMIEEGRRF
ncbi:MAG: hypothetical protein V7K39_02200, partial [Nostoc sp.]